MKTNTHSLAGILGTILVSVSLSACAGDMEKKDDMMGDKMMDKKSMDSGMKGDKMMDDKPMDSGMMGDKMKKEM